MPRRQEDLVRRLQQLDMWVAELDERIEQVVWRNSLPTRDTNRPMKVFHQSHVELETVSGGNLAALDRFDKTSFDSNLIRASALRFTRQRFLREPCDHVRHPDCSPQSPVVHAPH